MIRSGKRGVKKVQRRRAMVEMIFLKSLRVSRVRKEKVRLR